jgi:hypothetical protein
MRAGIWGNSYGVLQQVEPTRVGGGFGDATAPNLDDCENKYIHCDSCSATCPWKQSSEPSLSQRTEVHPIPSTYSYVPRGLLTYGVWKHFEDALFNPVHRRGGASASGTNLDISRHRIPTSRHSPRDILYPACRNRAWKLRLLSHPTVGVGVGPQ